MLERRKVWDVDPLLLPPVPGVLPGTAADCDASAAGTEPSCPRTSSAGPPAFAGLSEAENPRPVLDFQNLVLDM